MLEAAKTFDINDNFVYYITGEVMMDVMLNEQRKHDYIEYMVVYRENNSTEHLYTIFNKLYKELENGGHFKLKLQDFNNYTIYGKFDNHPTFKNKNVIYRLCVSKENGVWKKDNLYNALRNRDFSITSICRHSISPTGYIDFTNGIRAAELRTLSTVRDVNEVFKNPLKIFYALYLTLSRNLVLSSSIQTYISEQNYDNVFRDTDKKDISKYLRYLFSENQVLFRKMLTQYTNLTNYLYKNLKDLK